MSHLPIEFAVCFFIRLIICLSATIVEMPCELCIILTANEFRKPNQFSTKIFIADTDCVNPGSPTNGRRFGDGFNIGDVVRFECGSGFTLYGSPKRRCKKDGNWTGIPATCEGIT